VAKRRPKSKAKTLTILLKSAQTDTTNIVTGALYQYKAKKQAVSKPWRKKTFHPSGLLNCERKQVAVILYWQKAKPNFTPKLLDIFDNGHYVHDRIQKEMIAAGLVPQRNMWFPHWSRSIYKPYTCEVPIRYDPWLLSGTCDAIIIYNKKYYIVEIKSMNDWSFNQLRKPHDDHYCQGQAYLKMSEQTLKIEIAGIIYLYENKNDQRRKEFLIEKDEVYLKKLAMKLLRLKKNYVEKNKVPNRQFEKDSTDCEQCDMAEWCWKEAK